MCNEKIGRITALDPAKWNFKDKPINERLNSDDALFVDVIHTDGGSVAFLEPQGHVDFYPNGGIRKQVGCSWYDCKF